MSAAERVARILTLVPWLRERPGASLAEAAQACGVSERTVRGDLRALNLCDLPGLGGASLFQVELWGDRVLVEAAEGLTRPLRLNPREALHLVLTLSAVAEALGDEIPELTSALGKVRQAVGLPEDTAARVGGLQAPWLAEVREAIESGRRLRLAYRGRSDAAPRDRVVDPWMLQVTRGAWYLQAHDRDARGLRTFRLDRISRVEVLDEARVHEPPTGPLPEPRYSPGPDDTTVEVVLDPPARWVAEHVAVDEREELPGGRLRLRFHTDAPDYVAGLLVVAGTGAEVLAPVDLADRVRERARCTLRRYHADGSG